jgi:hypothetical protein
MAEKTKLSNGSRKRAVRSIRPRSLARPKRRWKPHIFDLPRDLVEAVKARKLVPLVGAGVSRQAKADSTFPTWQQLLVDLHQEVQKLQRISKPQSTQVNDLLKSGNFLMAAQVLRDCITDDSYWTFLQSRFQPKDAKPGEIHKTLFQLKPPIILTTNYDLLLEHAFADIYHSEALTYTYKNATEAHRQLRKATPSDHPIIFKLHGSIKDPKHIILSEYEYRKLIYREPGYRTFLSAIFVTNTVLMLGFSLRDRELNLLLESLQEAFSYGKKVDYVLLSYSGTKSIEMKQIENNFGVQILQYKGGKTHKPLLDFVNQLAQHIK